MTNSQTMGAEEQLSQQPESQPDSQQESQQAGSLASRVVHTLKSMASFAELLRFGGAAVVVASMSNLMLQGWAGANDTQHYFILLLQTVLLAVAGFTMSYVLKENKSARIFFGLGLISVTANFTILGALIYSLSVGANPFAYPDYARWVASSPQTLAITVAAALAVLYPISRFAFMVMSRPAAGRLSILFILSNLVLLLPMRGSAEIGLIFIFCLVVLTLAINRLLGKQSHVGTPGASFARGLLYLPLLVMLGRAAFLYSADDFLLLSISLSIYLALRAFSMRFSGVPMLKTAADLLAYGSSFYIANSIAEIVSGSMINLYLPSFILVLLGFNAELLRRVSSATLIRWIHYISSSVLLVSLGSNLLFEGSSIMASALCLFAGAGMVVYAWARGYRLIMLYGGLLLIMGVAYQLQGLVGLLFSNNWVSLAIIGTSAIVLASLIERHGATVRLKTQQWLQVAKNKRLKSDV